VIDEGELLKAGDIMRLDRDTFKTTLEISTNVAVLLVAVVLLSLLAINIFVKPPIANLNRGLEKGKAFSPIRTVDYADSEKTLLIALNTSCPFCRESLPLYQRLVEALPQPSKALHIVAIFPNREADVGDYLRDNHLTIDAVAEVDLNSLRISGTPTVILIDRSGAVKDFWNGKLTENEAQEFLNSVIPHNGRSN
jgi:thiol-disulfide isomerase/thioredoxin